MALDDDSAPAAPTRVGSNADLARRMDRMETRQDTMESKVTDLTAVVTRVEQNQNHVAELNKLRFDALDTGVKTVDTKVSAFITRMEGLLTGEVQSHATEEYAKFRNSTESRLEAIEDRAMRVDARNQGIFATFTGSKAVILVIAALASPIITIVAILLNSNQ